MYKRIQNAVLATAGLAALALGGAAVADATSSSGTSTTQSGTTTQSRPAMPAPGSASHENAEKPVTGDAADKAKAAAEKSVGSGSTATDVTTDFTGNGYEVTVKKADGSTVEVHLDKAFNVRQGGPGGPGGHFRGHFGPPPGAPSGSGAGTGAGA